MSQDQAQAADQVRFRIQEDPNVKVLEINGHAYKIRKWTWLEKDQVSSDCYERLPGQAIGRVNLHKFNTEVLQRCVAEWPQGVTLETLEADEGDQLILAVQGFVGGFRAARLPAETGNP